MKWKDLINAVDPFDECGFQTKPLIHWVEETPEQEIERLTWNTLKYEQCVKNKTRYPRKVNEQLMQDYKRLAFLKGGLKLVGQER
jgi:hypothetical protein